MWQAKHRHFWEVAVGEAQRLAGKTALITGAAQGLGAAMARMFARHGARVLVTDINADGAAAVAGEIGGESIAHDVTSPDEWQRAVALAEERFGGLNILVNNAGIGTLGSVEDCTLEDWRRVHAIDIDGVFLGCKLALPLMARTTARGERGAIVNISSIAGIVASANMAAYNSAKAAVRHLSKSVALHCARAGYDITCNSIHPVFVDTPILDGLVAGAADRDEGLKKLGRQIPLGRVGEPGDIAYAALYLASDEAKFVTGAELKVDGGISAM